MSDREILLPIHLVPAAELSSPGRKVYMDRIAFAGGRMIMYLDQRFRPSEAGV